MKIALVSLAAIGILIAGSFAQTTNKSGQKSGEKATKETSKAKEESTYVSPDKGIGPIKEIKLGPIDSTMVARGEELFGSKCVTCHLLDKKKLGPPLRNVVNDRPPEFIMNMMLNTDEMEKKDDQVKKLIEQYMVYMTPQELTQKQARDILEYLRQVSESKPEE
jgi:cytochrome c